MNTPGRKQGANKVEIVKIQKMATGGINPATNEEIPPLTVKQIGQALAIEDEIVEKFMPTFKQPDEAPKPKRKYTRRQPTQE